MTDRLVVLVPDELKPQLEKKAQSMGLNLSSFVRLILTQKIQEK